MESTALAHFNIKGSHWGDRRWQYKDGSLTPAGRERYRKMRAERDSSKASDKTSSKKTYTSKTSEEPKKKTISEMSDDELKKVIARLQLEKQYKDLLPKEEKTVTLGQRLVEKLKDGAASAVETATKNVLSSVLENAGKSILKLKTSEGVGAKDSSSKNKKNK